MRALHNLVCQASVNRWTNRLQHSVSICHNWATVSTARPTYLLVLLSCDICSHSSDKTAKGNNVHQDVAFLHASHVLSLLTARLQDETTLWLRKEDISQHGFHKHGPSSHKAFPVGQDRLACMKGRNTAGPKSFIASNEAPIYLLMISPSQSSRFWSAKTYKYAPSIKSCCVSKENTLVAICQAYAEPCILENTENCSLMQPSNEQGCRLTEAKCLSQTWVKTMQECKK